MQDKLRTQIIDQAQVYYKQLESDWSHNFDHFLRVERLALEIAKYEQNVDLQVLQASCLLFDIARKLEDDGEIEDHTLVGVKLATDILEKTDFPKIKIPLVSYAIKMHRKSQGLIPNSIEAKILQDADYLDALGAVDIVRVVSSCLTSKKYAKPIYVSEQPLDKQDSALGYLSKKLNLKRLQPENFFSKRAKEMAKLRIIFTKKFIFQFINEWQAQL